MKKLFESIVSPTKNQNSAAGKNSRYCFNIGSNNSNNNSGSNSNYSINNNNNNNNNNERYSEIVGDNIIKIVVLGGYSVGKSSIIRRYLQNCFTTSYLPTVGIDLSTLLLKSKNNSNNINVNNNNHNNNNKNNNNEKSIEESKEKESAENSYDYLTDESDSDNILNDKLKIGPPNQFIVQFWDISYAEIKGKHFKSILQGVSGIIMVYDSVNASSILAVDEWKSILNSLLNQNNSSAPTTIPLALFANKCDSGEPVISASDLDYYCNACGYSLWRFTSSKKDINIESGIDSLLSLCIDNKFKEYSTNQNQLIETKKEKRKQRYQLNKKLLSSSTNNHNHRKSTSSSKLSNKLIISQSLPNISVYNENNETLLVNNNNNKSNHNNINEIDNSESVDKENNKNNSISNSNNLNNSNNNSNNNNNNNNNSIKQKQDNNSIKLQLEVDKVNELLNLTNESYIKFQKQLEELMSKSNGTNRYNDLIQLEAQRNNEYVKICNNLKKLIQPNVFSRHHHHHHHHHHRKITPDIISKILDENILKWTTLISNLQLERSLKSSNSDIQQQQQQNQIKVAQSYNAISLLIKEQKSTNRSIIDTSDDNSDTDDDNYNQAKEKINSNIFSNHNRRGSYNKLYNSSNNNINNNYLTPSKNNNNNNNNNNNINNNLNAKHKMGFGFKNRYATSYSINSNDTSIDIDNPISSSSSMTSTSSSLTSYSSSPPTNCSPSTSPPNIEPPSPSLLPSSYNLNVEILPI